MPLLLVDERDGRVIGELESQEQALRLLARLDVDHPELAGRLCVVELRDRQGTLVGTESSVTIRPL
jgi:hypothetical protein